MLKIIPGITGIILLLFLTGCTHYYYIPATVNVPLFKEKNEFRLSASSGGGDETSTTDVQAAYAVTDKIGLLANFMAASGGTSASNNRGEGKYFEAALGYFKPYRQHGVFEIYGGLGAGNQNHFYPPKAYGRENSSAQLSFSKLFLQPSAGFTYHGFDIALTTGFSTLSFYRITSQIDTPGTDYMAVNNISNNRTSLLFEPSITLRGGWKYLKLQLQYTAIQNLTHPELQFESNKLSIGLSFAFARRFDQIKNNEKTAYIKPQNDLSRR